MPKKTQKNLSIATAKSWTLTYPPRETGVSDDAATATVAVEGLAHNAVTTVQFSQWPLGELALTDYLEALKTSVSAVHQGSLREAEALLVGQATALNAIFTNLALRAKSNMGEHLDATDRYLRLALKAQSQCRATLETLATIKNSPAVFAKQANIAHGPQQVNNGMSLARAENSKSAPNKLLEAHGERLDLGEAGAPGTDNQVLATVGTLHRAENNRG